MGCANRIGFFLHIPFPSFEVLRQLPTRWRRELLEGVLGADLMGFHTHDYAQHFLHSVFRTLGYEHHLGRLNVNGALKRVDSFPIGIDFQRFWEAAVSDEVATERAKMARGLGDRQIIFSVDRLDYSKGILHRLRGFEAFLLSHPAYRGKVTFVLLVVPSREQVERYQLMKQELDELVGQLNGAHGSVDWVPIVYQYRSAAFNELVALYNLASVFAYPSLYEGFGLPVAEALACGVPTLTARVGATAEIAGDAALLVDPYDTPSIAAGLEMLLENGQVRNQLIEAGPRRAARYTWDAAAHQVLGLYERGQ
jgi:trehalose 6-phosphate synthase/phosphatase